MTLDPDRYQCPDHHTDLTGLVEEALSDDGPPLAYRRSLLGRQVRAERPFQVIVTCPGARKAPPHALICTGMQKL